MVEKHINIDLNDPRAIHIAEVMKSKTAKRILDLIADGEYSETDISDKLDMPLNTVGYNIKKLLKAGLIVKSKNYFWSSRGKKIATYNISNKKIIISPSRIATKPIVMILGLIGIFAVIALFSLGGGPSGDTNFNDLIKNAEGNVVLNQFSSIEEMEKFIEERSNENGGSIRNFGGEILEGDFALTADSSSSSASSEIPSLKQTATDVSSTNVQVLGIDEPDFVKNDEEYIYIISGVNLYIIDAFPAEDMRIISNFTLNDSSSNMFLGDDKIVIMQNFYEEPNSDSLVEKIGFAADILPRNYNSPKTKVLILDISDRKKPGVNSEYIYDGNYMDSRMIGDHIYIVSQKYNYDYGRDSVLLPEVSVDGVSRELALDDVFYSEEYDENIAFTFVNAIDLNSGEQKNRAYLIGTGGTIYVSAENIYLTSVRYLNHERRIELKIEDGILPLLSGEYKTRIEELLEDEDIYYYQKEDNALKIAKEYSFTLSGDAQSDFVIALDESLEEAGVKISNQYERTVIHKISIDELDISYDTSGEVPGHLLNQFSLDEYDDNLRVATTTGNWRDTSLNHLFVLDNDLDVIGSVEDLAPGERIYSARFLGSRAYMVTFRQTDPLYAIDLSNPKKPEVLGYLKVTGYSSYLHPYDEDHIIGVGMEADLDGRVTGVKIALFDVSDTDNIIEKSKYTLESESDWSWSSSEALYDHHAFLFDKEKNLLVVPIQYSYNSRSLRYGRFVGAYVFNIDKESIYLKGKITHIEEYNPRYGPAYREDVGNSRIASDGTIFEKTGDNSWELKDALWYDKEYDYYREDYTYQDSYIDSQEGGISYYDYSSEWDRRIQRSLFMDDYLYTVSLGLVRANLINTLEEISEVEISYDTTERYYSRFGSISVDSIEFLE